MQTIRSAQEADAPLISDLVRRTLRVSNAGDYPAAVIARVAEGFSAKAVLDLMRRRFVLVACRGATVVGTASLESAVVRTVFVAPEVQGQGVGKALMSAIETWARRAGGTTLQVPASLTATAFYARLGYREVRQVVQGEERTVVMEKPLI